MEFCMESVSKNDFNAIHILGRGRFGRVYQMERKGTGEQYAMKVIVKEEIAEAKIKDQLRNEIKVQSSLDHKYILKLKMQSEDTKYVYLFMDLAEHGSLHDFLTILRRFPEIQAGKYIKQLLSALSYLHSNNIMHRDIKPENLMLSSEGNLLLGDFGWSSYIKSDSGKRLTICGTPEYIPPEMIMEIPHSDTVDTWAVGILCYELLVGFTPFRESETNQTKAFSNAHSDSMNTTPMYSFSKNLQNFLNCCLMYDSFERSTCSQLLAHKWVLSQDEDAPSIIDVFKEHEAKKKNASRNSSDDILSHILQQCESSYDSISSSSSAQNLNNIDSCYGIGDKNYDNNIDSSIVSHQAVNCIDKNENNSNNNISGGYNIDESKRNIETIHNNNGPTVSDKSDKTKIEAKTKRNSLKCAYLCTKMTFKENDQPSESKVPTVIVNKCHNSSRITSSAVESKNSSKASSRIVKRLKAHDINANSNAVSAAPNLRSRKQKI